MRYKTFSICLFFFSFHSAIAQKNDTVNAAGLNNYLNKVLVVFNRCKTKDDEIARLIKTKNAIAIESVRKELLQCSMEGLKELDAMENFDTDPSLKYSCRDVLKFYKQLAESDITQVRDIFIVEENYQRLKQDFEKRPVKKHSSAEIYNYNTEIKRYNEAEIRYAQLSGFIERSRKLTLYNWNASIKIFADAHKKS
jgi:hypothetical protein